MSEPFQPSRAPPEQVAYEAKRFTKTLGRFTDLPTSTPKKTYIRYLAEDKNTDIDYTIARNIYQNHLYHQLEESDTKKRNKIRDSLVDRQTKIDKNQVDLDKKRKQKDERFDKHMSEVYKKHDEMQKTKRLDKNEEAYKLRKELLEFYDKERKRKRSQDHKQVSVSTCYGDAVRRINEIHEKNVLYAAQSERDHLKRMQRNNGKQRNLLYTSRMKSADNKKKEEVYINNCEIMEENEHHHIQTYCKDLNISDLAFQHKDKDKGKTKERLHKFFKERVEKWHELKHRVDERKAEVPNKCLNILDKTTKASFRHTVSTFKDSGKQWYNIVQRNKQQIYDDDDYKKDLIMQEHLDRRMRNSSQFTVNQRMGSMRDRAKKLSSLNTPKKLSMSSSMQVA